MYSLQNENDTQKENVLPLQLKRKGPSAGCGKRGGGFNIIDTYN